MLLFGRYRWTRIPKILPGGEIFHRRLDQAIQGTDWVKTVANDFPVIRNGGTTAEAVKDRESNRSPCYRGAKKEESC